MIEYQRAGSLNFSSIKYTDAENCLINIVVIVIQV